MKYKYIEKEANERVSVFEINTNSLLYRIFGIRNDDNFEKFTESHVIRLYTSDICVVCHNTYHMRLIEQSIN